MAVSGRKASTQVPSSIYKASEEELEVYCQPCEKEETRLPARGYCTNGRENLCKTCFTVHKKHELTRHHILQDASSIPTSLQQPSTSTNTGQSNDQTITCLKHQKEIIGFYCHNHEKILCMVCFTLEHHTASCKVDFISDISGNTIDSKHYQAVTKEINNTLNQFQFIVEDVKKTTHNSKRSIEDALADIKTFREQINQRLDKLESQAERIKQKRKKHLNEVETTSEDVTKSLMETSEKIKQFNKSKQADNLFIELKLAEQVLNDVKEKSLQILSYNVKKYRFKPNGEILNQLKAKKSLGAIQQKTVNTETKFEQIYEGLDGPETHHDKEKKIL
ncbi:transcription intermediary factor 1-alpha-like [Ruditapes philippinarum]|uniref:transcription intermediary factor 1-alpha-like n=1 Tax=Ruditapes philippinarum TaxID=129788 RepID=UPI00295A5C5E|nr:transcription intermediary factor 1-alpha-like [Ruditapes philippinarum]